MPQLAERVHRTEQRSKTTTKRPPCAESRLSRTVTQLQSRSSGAPLASGVSSRVSEAVSSGDRKNGLPPRLRTGVEALSGMRMDDIRVYRNSSEPAKLGALAFTRGTEIHLGPGEERQLPHEAWHVVQQKQGRVQATTQMKGQALNTCDALETEADRMGAKACEACASKPMHTSAALQGGCGSVVQRKPDKADWKDFESMMSGEPRLLFWAKRHGSPPSTYGEMIKLQDAYKKVENNRETLEEYDRAQLAEDRSKLESRREAARLAEDFAAESRPGIRQKERKSARDLNRRNLRQQILAAWNDRNRYITAGLIDQAKTDVARKVSLPRALTMHHWSSPQNRWTFIYFYYRERGDLSSIDEAALAAAFLEEDYLEAPLKEADERELAAHRKGDDRAARTEQIKKLAATRPMNPLQDFEPGVHDYSPYPGQPDSVDMDVASGDFDADNITIKYKNERTIDIPLKGNLLFPGKALDPSKVLRVFTRRHKKSQRLIPCVIYDNPLKIDLDVLSEEDLALLGIPRFDPALTPVVMYFLSPEFKMNKLTLATLNIAGLHAASLGLRQLGVPLAAGGLRTAGTILSGAGRMGMAAVNEVRVAVTAYGYSTAAAQHLAGRLVTYYFINAVEINSASFIVTDIALNLAGQDTGLFSPGDEVQMVVAEAQAGASAAKKSWKLFEGEVKEVEMLGKQATLRLSKVQYRYIAEKTAKAEYDLGKKLVVTSKSVGKGAGKAGGIAEEAIQTGKLAAYTFEHGGHSWPILKDGTILRCSRWCTASSVEEAFGDLIKSHPHLTDELSKVKKLKGKAAADGATALGTRLSHIRDHEKLARDDLLKLLTKPEFAKGTALGSDLRFIIYQKEGGKLSFGEWKRLVTKSNPPFSRLSERDAGPLMQVLAPSKDWEYHVLYSQGVRTNPVKGRNPLGSSEPEWYSQALNTAVEVKTKDFVEKLESVNWGGITIQLEQRIFAMPPGTKNWIVFDLRRQPLSVAEASIIPKLSPKWNEVFFMTDKGILRKVGPKAVPYP